MLLLTAFTALINLSSVALAAPDWETTLEGSVNAVVQLRVAATRPFDTDSASTTQGTGFIIDAERGYILTNRHLVQPGPVVAEAVFLNNEEVELQAIYRDPVHDFGIFRFDPEELRFMELVELPLAPESARVGVEIRVVGNDAGEKLSILAGTLARMDRNAPNYGKGNFNDFNTFYYQAASGTSGGSSGSPVLNIAGEVIALNAGGRRAAASSYYLPLDRVVRALDFLKAGEAVPRGTIQTTMIHAPYHEVSRLGLTAETEGRVRAAFPEATGMLVVRDTVPEGPADQKLQSGDIVVDIDGQLLAGFLPLEAALDNAVEKAVGEAVTVGIERGGEYRAVELAVQDLHAITPDTYLEMGGGVFNTLSYQMARTYTVPVGGVMVASTGYMLRTAGVPDSAVIESVDGEAVEDLAGLEAALSKYPDGERVPIRFHPIDTINDSRVRVVTIDRRWFPMQLCERDAGGVLGDWPCEASPVSDAELVAEPSETTFFASGPKAARKLAPSLVMVDFDVPYRIAGVSSSNFAGAGLVVDAAQGLVLVDRDTVPIALGDATLTFAGSVRIPGQVRFIHPVHNLAVVQYDPALLGSTPVESAVLREAPLEPGDKVWQVGLDRDHKVVSIETTVQDVDPLMMGIPDPPQFRDANLSVIDIAEAVPSVGGALVDKKGRVLATWASFATQVDGDRSSFFRGLPIDVARAVVDPVLAGEVPSWRGLGIEMRLISIVEAREQGLSDDRARALEAKDPQQRQVLVVARMTASTPGAELLQSGDLILAVDGQPVTRFAEVEAAGQRGSVALTILRDGEEQTVAVDTVDYAGLGVDRVVAWAGLVLHQPHLEVASQRAIEPEGIYISWYWYGSPAARYGLRPTRRIVAVDGVETPDLDAFLAAIEGRPDRSSVRLKTINLDERIQVVTMKLDLRYWPTREFQYEGGEWVRVDDQ